MTTDAFLVPETGNVASNGITTDVTALILTPADETRPLPDKPFIEAGCRVIRTATLDETERACSQHHPALVFMSLSGEDNLSVLRRCVGQGHEPVIVIVAENDQINTAAEAMREGAFDCLFRPFSETRLKTTIQRALRNAPKASAPRPLKPPAKTTVNEETILTASPKMRSILSMIRALPTSPVPVFITGDVGTGKSLFARKIHDLSDRSKHPFVTVDCATLTPQTIADELFGANGAVRRAEGGTLFLDGVCELAGSVQPQLLNLINSERIEVNGKETPTDIRLISASRIDPYEAIRDGSLRADLFYRLHVAPVELPPLAGRTADISLIANTKLAEFAATEGRHFTGISDEAMTVLTHYDWPGNTRELLNTLWTVVLMHPGPMLLPEHLPNEMTRQRPSQSSRRKSERHESETASRASFPELGSLLGLSLAEIEKTVIEATIKAENGSVPRAARILDISPSTIYRKRESWAKKSGRG